MGQRDGILVFPDTDAIIVNLDGRAVTAVGAKHDFYLFH
jgi:hypothetical protein